MQLAYHTFLIDEPDYPAIIDVMANIDAAVENPTLDLEDDRPIAVRRKRRVSARPSIPRITTRTSVSSIKPPSQVVTIQTPPATPQRSKKRVRFSDPGCDMRSTGLTPFINRTSLCSPPPSKSRRHSTPSSRWNLSVDDTPISGTLQFTPLRQVLEGRVKRRIRRNHLSEEINDIEWEKRHQKTVWKAEIEKLKEELRQKDREIEHMRDEQDLASQIGDESGTAGPDVIQSSRRIKNLENQITELKSQLEQREAEGLRDEEWTLAARDPFNDYDDTFMIPSYDEDFPTGVEDMLLSTPLRRSFPSPPATMPNTPSKPPSVHDAGIQVSNAGPDNEKLHLGSQLKTLQEELKTLSASLERNNTTHERLFAKLSPFSNTDSSFHSDSLDAALDTVLTQLALSQSAATESATQYSALTTELRTLGFPTSSPDGTIQLLRDQFRQARLDLEYLNPGETPEGFENSKLLSLLISRLRVLVEKSKQQDSDIDQYHEQEISLRNQLNARIDATNQLQTTLSTAKQEIQTLSSDLKDRDESLNKLTRALEGYRSEVRALESLITKVEDSHRSAIEDLSTAHKDKLTDELLRYDVLKAQAEGQEMIIVSLEERLNTTLAAATVVSTELTACTSRLKEVNASAVTREVEHGTALALRDSRVLELREEVERVNESLKAAHESIMALRQDNKNLETQVESEKKRRREAIEAMNEQLARIMETNKVCLGDDADMRRDGQQGTQARRTVRRVGGLLDGRLTRRSSGSLGGSGKKRRRYDSGLGFLDEEESVVEVGEEL